MVFPQMGVCLDLISHMRHEEPGGVWSEGDRPYSAFPPHTGGGGGQPYWPSGWDWRNGRWSRACRGRVINRHRHRHRCSRRTYSDTDTQTHRDIHTQTERDTDTDADIDADTDTDTHRHTHTHQKKHTHTQKHIHTHTYTAHCHVRTHMHALHAHAHAHAHADADAHLETCSWSLYDRVSFANELCSGTSWAMSPRGCARLRYWKI